LEVKKIQFTCTKGWLSSHQRTVLSLDLSSKSFSNHQNHDAFKFVQCRRQFIINRMSQTKQQEPWQEAGGARHVLVKEGEEEGEEEGREE
jgi:hypothetical protein